MIRIDIVGEHQSKPPDHTVKFEFRRHQQAKTTRSVENTAYLVGSSDLLEYIKLYPIKVDGAAGVVEVRRSAFETLGFRLVVLE